MINMDSLWMIYFANGQINSEITSTDGLKNGDFVKYYENGGLKTTGAY